MKNILAFLLLCWTSIAFAQNAAKFTLSGTITDGTTGETLIGATVKSTNGDGAISNEYGFYSLTLPSGQYSFSVAYLGYGTATYNVNLSQNQQLNITLSEQTIVLGAVEINARKSDESISQPDTITVEMRNIDRTTYKYFLALMHPMEMALMRVYQPILTIILGAHAWVIFLRIRSNGAP